MSVSMVQYLFVLYVFVYVIISDEPVEELTREFAMMTLSDPAGESDDAMDIDE